MNGTYLSVGWAKQRVPIKESVMGTGIALCSSLFCSSLYFETAVISPFPPTDGRKQTAIFVGAPLMGALLSWGRCKIPNLVKERHR